MRNPERFKSADKPEIKAETSETREDERQEIEAIEKSSLVSEHKKDLLLVYLKSEEKPAALLPFEYRFNKTDSDKKKGKILQELERKKEEVGETMKRLGFLPKIENFEGEEGASIIKGFVFLIGQDADKLNQLEEALKSGTSQEIRLALGYPKSAVEGFINDEMFYPGRDLKELSKKEREELRKEGVFKFLGFGLSKDSWREELDLVRKYQKLIQEKSPRIYNELLKTGRDPFRYRGRLETAFERILKIIEVYKKSPRKVKTFERPEEQFEQQPLKAEEEPAAGEEKEPEKDPEQESLRERINRVSGIFRAFKFIDDDIRRHHFDPLFKLDNSDEYIKGIIPTCYSESQKLTETDFHQAENRNIALAFEVAGQILQRKSAGKDVREDPKLLEQLCLTLRKAGLMFMNMRKQRREEAQDLLKKILVERKGIPEGSIKPEQIKQLADSMADAHDFIYLKEKMLEKHSEK